MAKIKRSFVVSILSEQEPYYYGDCSALTVPTQGDTITILPQHTPIIAKLGKGQIVIYSGRERSVIPDVTGGLLYVGEDEVTVLVNL